MVPVRLDLTGLPWRDLAGFHIRFRHTKPEKLNPDDSPDQFRRFSDEQKGEAGNITASRKAFELKGPSSTPTPEDPVVNLLYVEWFSTANGQVLLESGDLQIEILDGPTWTMTPEEEEDVRKSVEPKADESVRDMIERTIGPVLEQSRSAFERDEEADPVDIEEDLENAPSTLWMEALGERIALEMYLDETLDFEIAWEEVRPIFRKEHPHLCPLKPREEKEFKIYIEESVAEMLGDYSDEAWLNPALGDLPPLVEHCTRVASYLEHLSGKPSNPRLADDLFDQVTDGTAAMLQKVKAVFRPEGTKTVHPTAGNLTELKKARSDLKHAIDAMHKAATLDEEVADLILTLLPGLSSLMTRMHEVIGALELELE